ncbi:Galactarate dehydratase (L-threo-forming) (plasmid) [Caballeronia sp. SBC1]|nr:Galactarate dehydratase (L-threo-forming) [Caballeronia sp. SBC2]QIN65986.1 Galactarate dehydratase (L-threo-forming) [Caballeronia sp. SBC1]
MAPIRAVRNISLTPNFGGEVMTVSLRCGKLPPEHLMPVRASPIATAGRFDGDVVVLQANAHVGFQSMIDYIMCTATHYLERLNQWLRETCPASDLAIGVHAAAATPSPDSRRFPPSALRQIFRCMRARP